MSLNTSINPINGYQSMLNRSQLNGDLLNVNNLTVNNSFINQGTTSLVGSLDVSGISTFENNVIVKANISIHGNIDVSGNIDFNNDVDILGNLDVSGITTFNNNVIANTKIIAENIDVSGTLTVNNITLANDLDISGTLTVEGTSTFNNQLSILNVDPGLIIQSTANTGIIINSNSDNLGLNYNYISFRSGNIDKLILGYDDATGNAEINKYSSSIPLDIYSNTTFKKDVQIDVDLDVIGDTTLNTLNVSGATIIHSTLDVSGISTFNNSLIAKSLDVSGATIIHSTLDVSGISTFNNSLIAKSLDVSGATKINNNLDVIGDTTLNTLDVSGATIIHSTLDVSGISTFNNSLIAKSLDVSGATKINNNLDVIGDTTLSTLDVSGATKINNNLDVVGDTTLNTLDVSGATKINNNLDVIGDTTLNTLDVSGKTVLHSTLDVSGDTNLSNVIVSDISGSNAYFNNLSAGTFNLGENIDISGVLYIKNDTSGISVPIPTIYLTKGQNINLFAQNTNYGYAWNTGWADKYYIASYDSTYHDYLTIDASGQVGLSITSPTQKLHIEEGQMYLSKYNGTSGSYSTILTNIDVSGAVNAIRFTGAGSALTNYTGIDMSPYYGRSGGPSSAIYGINSTAFSSHIGFFTANDGSLGANTLEERARIDTSGRMGINTAFPSEKLTVNNGNLLVRSDDSNIIYQNFDISGSGTEFGAHVIQRNFSERYAGACWSDIGSGIMTLNRFNSYQIKYYNSASFSANGTYFPTTNWTSTPSNAIDNASSFGTYSLLRSFSTVGTYFNPGRIRYDGAVSKYFQVVATGAINDAGQAFMYGYMDHYDSSATTSTKVAGNITQYYNTANFTMTAVVLLDNLDEIRLFFYTPSGTSTAGLVLSISIAEIF